MRLFVITGRRGTGKSHLAHEMATTWLPGAVVIDEHYYGANERDRDLLRYISVLPAVRGEVDHQALAASLSLCAPVQDFILARMDPDDVIQVFRSLFQTVRIIKIDMGHWSENPYLAPHIRHHLAAGAGLPR